MVRASTQYDLWAGCQNGAPLLERILTNYSDRPSRRLKQARSFASSCFDPGISLWVANQPATIKMINIFEFAADGSAISRDEAIIIAAQIIAFATAGFTDFVFFMAISCFNY